MGGAKRRGVLVGMSSDIGLAIARDWISRDISVFGTYRTASDAVNELAANIDGLFRCDFSDPFSIDHFVSHFKSRCIEWDYLIICPGIMEPVGPFGSLSFAAWRAGFEVNFMATLQVIHGLLPFRSPSPNHPLVLLFAGGGTNGAPVAFSAYTAAKIGLIKMVELLDAEIQDVRFTIIGPGWVRTKIHDETLRAEELAPEAAAETRRRLTENEFNPMSHVVECVGWALEAPREVIGGRNFSVVHDDWAHPELDQRLRGNADLYKLRREGN